MKNVRFLTVSERNIMISIELSPAVEKQFFEIVQKSYDGDLKRTFLTLLNLHTKYGWKEQLVKDVKSIRSEVRRQREIKTDQIENAIKKYRKTLSDE
jgi:undecaprenyl pyrophosphate synthase